jgi:4-aminobutyrate aminotransferase-like enzyme
MLSAGYSAIRIAPPLVITQEQADTACTILDGIFTDVEKKFGIKK